MVKVKPVDRTVDKQVENARGAREDYEHFVQNPRRDPVEGAVAAKEDLKAKMREDKTWDKWESKLKGVGGKGVIDAAIEKGVDRYVPGVEYGSKIYEQFYSQFKDHLERNLDEVLDMPNKNLSDAKKRATKMIDLNAEFSFER